MNLCRHIPHVTKIETPDMRFLSAIPSADRYVKTSIFFKDKNDSLTLYFLQRYFGPGQRGQAKNGPV